MQYRNGESSEKSWYRSDRFFSMNGQWFFTTREHLDMGPFISRQEAEIELAVFIRHVTAGSGLHLSGYDHSFFTGEHLQRTINR